MEVEGIKIQVEVTARGAIIRERENGLLDTINAIMSKIFKVGDITCVGHSTHEDRADVSL